MIAIVGPGPLPFISARNAVLATPPLMRSSGTLRSPVTLNPSLRSSSISNCELLNSCCPSSLYPKIFCETTLQFPACSSIAASSVFSSADAVAIHSTVRISASRTRPKTPHSFLFIGFPPLSLVRFFPSAAEKTHYSLKSLYDNRFHLQSQPFGQRLQSSFSIYRYHEIILASPIRRSRRSIWRTW